MPQPFTQHQAQPQPKYAEVERRCNSKEKPLASGCATWCMRELARRLQSIAMTWPLWAKLRALRLLLINTLEPLLRGDKMTAEQFKEMLRYVKANKRKAAEDALASYAERSTEQI